MTARWCTFTSTYLPLRTVYFDFGIKISPIIRWGIFLWLRDMKLAQVCDRIKSTQKVCRIIYGEELP